MKAVVYTRYGGPEELHLEEVPKPSPSDGEVLIKVHAVSLNDWDWGLLTGTPRIFRRSSGPKYRILGSDVAGVVESVGSKVTKFKVGDTVFGDLNGTWGGLAEFVCARENQLAVKPASMSFEEAAAIPQAAMLAVQGLIDRGGLRDGLKILINGAGGGVGTFGVQIAKQYKVEVTGVDSGLKLDLMRAAGFDHVIDYTKDDFTKSGKRYDLIVDAKTSRSIFEHARALNPGGVYATVGGHMNRLLGMLIASPFVGLLTGKHFRIVMLRTNKDLEYMKDLFISGKCKAFIDGPYKLEETPEVFAKYGRGEQMGKMVIVI